MSRESVDLVVDQTIVKINADMAALNGAPIEQQVKDIMLAAITHAYSQVEKDDRKYLYRRLGLQFHPDRLPNSQQEFAVHLIHDEVLIKIPQQVLEQVKSNEDLLNTLKSDPTAAMNVILTEFAERFKDELEQYNRYVTPIAIGVITIRTVIDIVMAIAQFSALAVVTTTTLVIPFIEKSILNLITDGQYDLEVEKTIKKRPLVEFAEGILKAQGVDIAAVENDEEMMSILYAVLVPEVKTKRDQATDWLRQAEELTVSDRQLAQLLREQAAALNEQADRIFEQESQKIDNTLAMAQDWAHGYDKLNVSDITRFKAIINAFMHHITSELPQDNTGKALAILNRALLSVLLVAFLVIDAAVQLARVAGVATFLAVIAVALFVKVAATLLLNSPLYAWDGLTYLVNALVSTLSQVMDTMKAYFTADASPDADAASNTSRSLLNGLGMFAPSSSDPLAGNDDGEDDQRSTPGYGSFADIE